MEMYYVLCVENQEVFDLPDDYVGLFTNMKELIKYLINFSKSYEEEIEDVVDEYDEILVSVKRVIPDSPDNIDEADELTYTASQLNQGIRTGLAWPTDF